jgi:hypothetical protein
MGRLECALANRKSSTASAVANGAADRVRRYIECLEQAFEAGLVLDHVEHLSQRHQLDAVEFVGDERIEIVAAKLPVGHDVAADLLLEPQEVSHAAVGHTIEFRARKLPPAKPALRFTDFWRPGPAAHRGYRKQRKCGHT